MTVVDTSEFGAVLPRPQYDMEIAHGYTLKQINGLAVHAAKLCNWVNGMELTDRAVSAWSAIAEHLQLSYSRPEETELVAIAWKAMKTQHYKDLRTHGMGGQDRSMVSKAYVRYWTTESAPTHSHEDRIVDTLAMAQIWPQLTRLQRDVLRALADHDDRETAARSLGMTRDRFNTALAQARIAFRKLWHEHETPSKNWGSDRPGSRHQNPMFLLRQRKRKAAQRAARPPRAPRKLGRPRRDLGISDADLLARHEAGESLNALARAFKVSSESIKLRLNSARAQLTHV